ncbi:MAG: hypothetical protein WC718_01300 [Phycisphaerales bacterium]
MESGLSEDQGVNDAACCEGCGSTRTVASLKADGYVSCCPERKMVSAREWRRRALHAEATRAPSDAALVEALEEENKRCRELLASALNYIGLVRSDDIAGDDPIFGVMSDIETTLATRAIGIVAPDAAGTWCGACGIHAPAQFAASKCARPDCFYTALAGQQP